MNFEVLRHNDKCVLSYSNHFLWQIEGTFMVNTSCILLLFLARSIYTCTVLHTAPALPSPFLPTLSNRCFLPSLCFPHSLSTISRLALFIHSKTAFVMVEDFINREQHFTSNMSSITMEKLKLTLLFSRNDPVML